jgi:hypothetical protein
VGRAPGQLVEGFLDVSDGVGSDWALVVVINSGIIEKLKENAFYLAS